jgi:segregation and condensation protein A
MSAVLSRLQPGTFLEFGALFSPEEGRMGVVVTLLAVLELVKESLIELAQADSFAPIYVHPVNAKPEEAAELEAAEAE